MNNPDLERRIAGLERQIQDRETQYVLGHSSDGSQLVSFDLELEALETRIRDLDPIERIAVAALAKAQKDGLSG